MRHTDSLNTANYFQGPTRLEISKPTIAAVDGWAVAGGLELSLMCDLRVVEESARLGVLCRRFGVPLIDGGTVRLPELIGLSRALDLIITGRIVEAREAYEMGLANRLVDTGTGEENQVTIPVLFHAKILARNFQNDCVVHTVQMERFYRSHGKIIFKIILV